MITKLVVKVIIFIFFVKANEMVDKADDSSSCCSPSRNIDGYDRELLGSIETDSQITIDVSKNDLFDISNMVKIPAGKFIMGTKNPKIFQDGEFPPREIQLDSFYIDKYEVSNENFKEFIDKTGYMTESEIYGWSFVFKSSISSSILDISNEAVYGAEWWIKVYNATWIEPNGPGSNVFNISNNDNMYQKYRGDLPVVQVSWNDAVAYCKWRNGRLPTEAEWEYAARAGENNKIFPWGNKFEDPKLTHRANIFHGNFPHENTINDGYEFLAPIDSFLPQNKWGLHHMIGNAWEWVHDTWTNNHQHNIINDKGIIHNPNGPKEGFEKTKKGGSFLCHKSYCYRYRNAARHHTSADSATNHGGFRCAI